MKKIDVDQLAVRQYRSEHTVAQTAEFFGISERTVARLVKIDAELRLNVNKNDIINRYFGKNSAIARAILREADRL